MASNITRRPHLVWTLIVLQFLLGLGAAICGGLLTLAPDGHLMGMPLEILVRSPFSSFLIPGILLFVFVGVYPLAVAYSLFARPAWFWPNWLNPFKRMNWVWAASLAAGTTLLIWISVQMFMLNAVNFLHVIYLVWGIGIIALTLQPRVRASLVR